MLALSLRTLASKASKKRASTCSNFCTASLQRVLVSKRDAQILIEETVDDDILVLCAQKPLVRDRCCHANFVIEECVELRTLPVETRVIKLLSQLRRHVNDALVIS